ncbi:prepilin-type N-terminal cleavage/methylation domain-containing protein [Sulfurimonas sp. C5]|uniref:type II secretion system protein n=1 Tax=Sulfurimonas sp. C5 TaxID=3036947 RepID=UPI0024559D22|nr:prepilin-type N-terminal cleavage/methylation domain-containing protein [Sulfurimonas sp. C5]MDH4944641.1 prepilin-type N-terminal cleavage/methylation domain-containing protein [Sulfurimonas sp. C5]
MKRAGFTMIELIFVIVILGILSAVALPKFLGVAEQANLGKLKSYVGTLNRTVAPALWSGAVSDGNNGAINGLTYAELQSQIATPEVGDTAATNLATGLTAGLPLACTAFALPAANDYTDAELLAWAAAGTATVGGVVYTIRCMDGSMTAAPHFVLTDAANTVIVK